MPGFHQRYEAAPAAVPRARHDVAAFAVTAGFEEVLVDDVRLAVSEAVTNAVLHGYRGAPGHVRVSAWVDDEGLSVVVRDGGAGMGPAVYPGLGCGLDLIAEVADAVTVSARSQGGTELSMRFARAAQSLVTAAAAA